jgi:hypothetical protein
LFYLDDRVKESGYALFGNTVRRSEAEEDSSVKGKRSTAPGKSGVQIKDSSIKGKRSTAPGKSGAQIKSLP